MSLKLDVEIRMARDAEIGKIESLVGPSFGRTLLDELDDQNKGYISLFVAWVGDEPEGYGFVSWVGCRASEVCALFPDIPEIYRLTVSENRQSRGIGSRLVAEIEAEAGRRGFSQMGLGVAHKNPRAYALYERLGYQELVGSYFDCYVALDMNGNQHHISDECRFMSKRLSI